VYVAVGVTVAVVAAEGEHESRAGSSMAADVKM
jgi:hypothetical protein